MAKNRRSKNKIRKATTRAAEAKNAAEALVLHLEQALQQQAKTLERERASQTLQTLRAAQLQPTTATLLLEFLNNGEQQIIKDIKAVAARLKRDGATLDPKTIMGEQLHSLGNRSLSYLLEDAGIEREAGPSVERAIQKALTTTRTSSSHMKAVGRALTSETAIKVAAVIVGIALCATLACVATGLIPAAAISIATAPVVSISGGAGIAAVAGVVGAFTRRIAGSALNKARTAFASDETTALHEAMRAIREAAISMSQMRLR